MAAIEEPVHFKERQAKRSTWRLLAAHIIPPLLLCTVAYGVLPHDYRPGILRRYLDNVNDTTVMGHGFESFLCDWLYILSMPF